MHVRMVIVCILFYTIDLYSSVLRETYQYSDACKLTDDLKIGFVAHAAGPGEGVPRIDVRQREPGRILGVGTQPLGPVVVTYSHDQLRESVLISTS